MTAPILTNSLVTIKGKGAQARTLAYNSAATLAYLATTSRDDLVRCVRTALGAHPTSDAKIDKSKLDRDQLAILSNELRIGRIVARLDGREFPKDMPGTVERIDWAREQINSFAASDAKRLTAGQKGRRSMAFDKAMNASKSWLSLLMADAGVTDAIGQADKGAKGREAAKTRGTNGNPLRGDGKGADKNAKTPSHSELVQAPAPLTAREAVNHVTSQVAALLAYSNKHAAIMPGQLGALVLAFHKDAVALASEWALEQDAKDAVAAEADSAKPKPRRSRKAGNA